MTEELKLEAFGRFKLGETPREVSDAVEGISYSKALKWKKEMVHAEENKEVLSLLDAEQTLVHNIAEETQKQLESAGAEPEAIEGELEQAISKIDGYKKLSDETIASASKLIGRINSLSAVVADVNELKVLVDSLARLQEAFFKSTTNNVNVFPGQGGEMSNSKVSAFEGMKRL